MRPSTLMVCRIAFVAVFCVVIPLVARGQNCQLIAAPPPMATFGGPATAGSGMSEVGVAVGAWAEVYPSPCDHGGASDWLVRWRRGLGDRFDLGFDGEVDTTGGNVGGTLKVAGRYQLFRYVRLEAGIGGSDTGFAARSFNADVGAVIGTRRDDKTWNYYAAARVAGSHGCANWFCIGSNSGHAPGAVVPLVAVGATARVADNVRFVMEASGFGAIISREHPATGAYLHFSFGVLFDVGKRKN